MRQGVAPGLVGELERRLGPGAVLDDPAVMASLSRDQSLWSPAGAPAAVVRARSTQDVRETLRTAAAHGAPVVPRGAGSGLSGGANAVDGCVVLCLDRMDRIEELDEREGLVTVQAGVLNGALNEALRPHGLWYPPDPASRAFSTIGGNIATNAGGLCCLKYGVTRDWVQALEVVLPDGRLLQTGGRTRKNVAGYDLTGLVVGSEGTLGVVTRATLRVRRAQPPASTVVAFFPTLEQAGAAIPAMLAVTPSLLELMDQPTIQAVDDWQRMELDRDAAALLIAQSDAPSVQQRREEVAALVRACQDAGASFVAPTDDPDEGEQLLAVRRLAYPALERLGAVLLDDVAVPRTRIADYLRAVGEVARRHGVEIFTFGHAGDGNLHPTVRFDARDEASRAAAGAAFDELLREAVAMGGTITGEHGVGSLKAAHLPAQLGETAMAIQAEVKRAFDPSRMMNPGKFV